MANGFDTLWGCVGAWYSGDWYTSGARAYGARVADTLARKAWLSLIGSGCEAVEQLAGGPAGEHRRVA